MMILTAGLGYFFRLILARTLSIEEFGLFFAVFGFLNMLYGFKTFGVGSAYVRFLGEYKEKKMHRETKNLVLFYVFIQLIIFGVISIVLLLLSNYLSINYFKTEKAFWPLIILTATFFFSIFISTFRGFFLGYQKMDFYSGIEFFQTAAAIVFTLIFFKLGIDFLAPSYAYLVSFLLVSLWSFFLFLRLFPIFKIKMKKDFIVFKKLVKFTIPVTIGAIASSLIASEDTIILTYFRSLKEVALYSVAMPTVSMMRYFPKALSIVIFPISTQLYFKDKNKLSETITQIYKYLFILIVPMSFIVFSFSREILNIFFGENFVEAATSMSILAVSMVFSTIYVINQNILIGVDKPKVYVKVLFIEAGICTLLDLILIPKFGIIGAAITSLISAICLLFFTSLEIRKYVNNKIPWGSWIKTIAVGLITVGLIYILKKNIELNLYVKLSIILIVAIIFYLTLIFLIKIITPKEIKDIFERIIPRKVESSTLNKFL